MALKASEGDPNKGKKAKKVKAKAADLEAEPAAAAGKKRKQPAEQQQPAVAETERAEQEHAQMSSGAAAAAPAEGDPPAHKPNKRRRSKKQPEEPAADITPEELARRAYQKERQELAKRLQAAGRPYKRSKPQKAKADTKQLQTGPAVGAAACAKRQQPGSGGGGGGDGGGKQMRGSKAAPWETGDRPDHPVAVIVVPIFWLKREHEMREVLEASAVVEKLLAGIGIDVGLDTTTPMSPGQKFRHWELQGVKVRIEIGPKEAQESSCILSVCTKPGEVAAKTPLKLGQPLLDAVREQLQLPAGAAEADTALLQQHLGASAGAAGSGGGALKLGRLSGNKAGDGGGRPAGKHTVFSGDDLEDDFQLQEEEPETKKQQAAKKKKIAPPPDAADVLKTDVGKPKAQTRAKTVTF